MAVNLSSTNTYGYNDINAIDGATNLTISYWMYQTAAQNDGASDGSSHSFINKGTALLGFKNVAGGAIPKVVGFGDGAGNNAFSQNNVCLSDTWYNIISTYNGGASAGSRTFFYQNGTLLTTQTDNAPASYVSSVSGVVIGGGAVGTWAGTLAHVMIWAGATLTASEVAQQWNKATPVVQHSSLVLYVPMLFDGNPGVTYDNGGNNLTGTNGTPTTATVGEPPVIWPAGAVMGHRNTFRQTSGLRRNRFQRLNPKRPLVQYG